MIDADEVERRRRRLIDLCRALPEAASDTHGTHVKFTVRGRTFAYYLEDHHGDGINALCCKAAPGEQQALVAADPDRFTVPAYMGARGWVNLRIDGDEVDWDEAEEMAVDSYRMVAPKRLSAGL